MYDEIVFWQPTEAFFNRVATHTARLAPPSQLAPFYVTFAPDAEYQRIQRARQRLAPLGDFTDRVGVVKAGLPCAGTPVVVGAMEDGARTVGG